jgi:hypothetical protein
MKHIRKALLLMLAMTLILSFAPVGIADARAARNSVVAANTIPSTMVVGTTYKVTITMKNTGSEAWTSAKKFKLTAIGTDPFTTVVNYTLHSTDAIKTNNTKQFIIYMKAPAKAGTYTTDWRMVKGTALFGATFTKKITVVPLALSSLVITTPAKKLTYIVGEKLDLTGLVVTGVYNNGTRKVQKVTSANVSGFKNTAPVVGEVLTIKIGGKTVTYKITVVGISPPTGLKFSAVTQTSISLKWNTVAGAVKYRVYFSKTATGTYTSLGYTVNTNYSVTSLELGTAYYFKVSTVGVYGEGPMSGFLGVQTLGLDQDKAALKKKISDCITDVKTRISKVVSQMKELSENGEGDSEEYKTLSGELSEFNTALNELESFKADVDSATTKEDLNEIEDQVAAIMDSLPA